jgi:RNA polymerase-binding transcription factor
MPSIDPSKSLEHRLRLRAEQLRREIATVRGRSEGPAAGEVSDPKDAADAQAQGIVADAEVERDLAELRQIDLTLRRIDDGSYGVCIGCGDPIDPRRVLAQPTALRCVECQAIAEGATTRVPNGLVGPRP